MSSTVFLQKVRYSTSPETRYFLYNQLFIGVFTTTRRWICPGPEKSSPNPLIIFLSSVLTVTSNLGLDHPNVSFLPIHAVYFFLSYASLKSHHLRDLITLIIYDDE
jgi:hypothetical protein